MNFNTLTLLPQSGKLNKWIRNAEAELRKEFGYPLKLQVEGIGNDYSMDSIVKLVSDLLSVPINKMVTADSRKNQEVEARFVAMYIAKKYIPGITYSEIGRFFNKDHTTILHGVQRVQDLLSAKDRIITEKVTLCEAELNNLINANKCLPDHT